MTVDTVPPPHTHTHTHTRARARAQIVILFLQLSYCVLTASAHCFSSSIGCLATCCREWEMG